MGELRVPVRINDQCKDDRLHGRTGHILVSESEPARNSFIVDIGEEHHCQLGSWEFDYLHPKGGTVWPE